MAHFAKVLNNLVTQVVVVDNKDILDAGGVESEEVGAKFCADLLGGTWVQTSYNGNIRKNFAFTDAVYDEARDAFIQPQPFSSWELDEATCRWQPPVAYPDGLLQGEVFTWDEGALEWVLQG